MAESLSAPWLNLTAEEKRLFGHLFRQADSESIGVVTGEAAVKFFEKTKLEPQLLGEIWQIADKENRGLLTPSGFGIVLRLIGHYQAGRYPTPELALRPGPLPRFDSVNAPVISPIAKSLHGQTPNTLEPQTSGSGPIIVPPLISEKAMHYAGLFENSGARDGILPGEQAKQIFERAGLPNEILGRIWSLADTKQKGSLNVSEFVIAMHLIASFKTGEILSLPSILPYGLHEAALRLVTGRSTSGAATLPIPRKPSVSGAVRGTPSSSLMPSTHLSSQSTGSNNDWLINPTDKLKFDLNFASLDKANRGYITGDEAVPFFCESKLPEDILAQIWDLADLNSAGQLTRDEFAVAMYLIRQQKANRSGMELLPSKLPANLVPPSMRHHAGSATSGVAPDLSSSAVTLPNSAAEDLFGLDALSTSITPRDQSIPEKIFSEPLPSVHEINPRKNILNSPTLSSELLPNVAKPFIPSSSFGQSLSQQATGSKITAPQNSRDVCPQISSEDLLGDNDREISKLLTNETVEIANLSNQVSSLAEQVQDIHNQKPITKNELTQSKSQKTQLEARLTHLRALHDHELKELRTLQELRASLQDENKTLQSETETLKNKLQGLQGELNQTINAVAADRLENANLKEAIRLINAQVAQLRPTLEKALLDARQQKGLVAINKKQLVTVEAERDKLKTEVELLSHKKENFDNSSSIARSPTPRTNTTPPISTTTNPFFRRKESSSENPFSNLGASSEGSGGTQQPAGFLQNVFGPPFGSSSPSELLESGMDQKSVRTSSLSSTRTPSVPAHPTDSVSFKPSFTLTSKPVEIQGLSEVLVQSYNPSKQQQQKVSDANFSTQKNVEITTSQLSASESKPEEKSIVSFNSNYQIDEVSSRIPNAHQSSVERTVTGDMLNSPSTLGEHQSSTLSMLTNERYSSVKDGSAPVNPQSIQPVRSVKDDFDSAFAGLGSTTEASGRTNTAGSSRSASFEGKNTTAFAKEFPPIAVLADSESDSSSEGVGFDDDFATAPPASMTKSNHSSGIGPESHKSKAITFRPTPENQNDASRSNIASVELLQTSDSTRSQESFTSLPRTSPEIVSSTLATAQPDLNFSMTETQLVSSVKSSLDDEFDEFYDLEDAKEGDENDEFIKISGNDQPDIGEFTPVFDKSLSVKDAQTHQGSVPGELDQPSDSNVQIIPSSNSKHDWDAIFSGLEATESSLVDNITTLTGSNNTHQSNNSQFQSEEALNDSDLRDDPSIKKLTGMGYQRSDALAALEKFDYNLERAANFLASQS